MCSWTKASFLNEQFLDKVYVLVLFLYVLFLSRGTRRWTVVLVPLYTLILLAHLILDLSVRHSPDLICLIKLNKGKNVLNNKECWVNTCHICPVCLCGCVRVWYPLLPAGGALVLQTGQTLKKQKEISRSAPAHYNSRKKRTHINAFEEATQCALNQCAHVPWGRSQVLGEEPGVRGGEEWTSGWGNETKGS